MKPLHRVLTVFQFAETGLVKTTGKYPIELETWLTVNGETWLGFHCSPENLENLAIGFLFNESIINKPEEIASVRVCDHMENIDIWLAHPVEKPQNWTRTSGCHGGVSMTSLGSPEKVISPYSLTLSELKGQISMFLEKLNDGDFAHDGVHTSALLKNGKIIAFSRDIGRHNTLDKISGEYFLKKTDLSDSTLITTGRISSEMVTKSARMGIPILVSLHSASAAAQELAEEAGITLVCHARKPRFSILAGMQRLQILTTTGKNTLISD